MNHQWKLKKKWKVNYLLVPILFKNNLLEVFISNENYKSVNKSYVWTVMLVYVSTRKTKESFLRIYRLNHENSWWKSKLQIYIYISHWIDDDAIRILRGFPLLFEIISLGRFCKQKTGLRRRCCFQNLEFSVENHRDDPGTFARTRENK